MEARSFVGCECFRGPDFGVSLDTEVQVVGDGQGFIGSLSSQVVQQSTSSKNSETLDSRKGDEGKLELFSYTVMLLRIQGLLVIVKVKELG